MTAPAPEHKQLPLWGYRRIVLDPGSDQEISFHVRDDEAFRVRHPEDDRIVVEIWPREE